MTTQSLTREGRTILRSRIRRHPKWDGSTDVASLSVADLVQHGLALGLTIPDGIDATNMADLRGLGLSGVALYNELDRLAFEDGRGGSGLADIMNAPDSPARDHQIASIDVSNFERDDSEDADAPEAEAAPAVSDDEKQIAVEVKAMTDALAAAMAQGDMSGFRAKLGDLARRAVIKPAPIVQTIAAIDPAKIKGHIPQIKGRKTMTQAGITALAVAKAGATALDVYDAPDAPAVDASYAWPDDTAALLVALATGGNVMLWGPAGTGKTEFAKQIAAHYGRPFVRISCDDQTDAQTLVGMTGLDGKGGMEWRDGQLAAAIRRPGTVILVDEPSVARPGAMFVLQAVLDGDRRLHIAETGEVVPVAPGVMFILADNTNGTGDMSGQYEATRRMNRATLDRLAVSCEIGYLPADREASVLVARAGCSRKVADTLCKFANLTRQKADGGQLSHGLGLRRLIALAKLIDAGVSPSTAFALSVLNTVPHDDREPLRQLWTSDVKAGDFK